MTTPPFLPLGNHLTSPAAPAFAGTSCARLASTDLAARLTLWPDLHTQVLKALPLAASTPPPGSTPPQSSMTTSSSAPASRSGSSPSSAVTRT